MRKMKMFATILLLIALTGVIIAWPFREFFLGGLILTACEAGLVGALADWFAVIALFRHPLGLKFIPHTAIISNNRERIIDSIVYMVEKEWLKIEVIKQKIQDYKFTKKICTVLQTEQGEKQLKDLIGLITFNVIKNIDYEHTAQFIQDIIRKNVSDIKVSSKLISDFEWSVKELYGNDIIDVFVNILKELINSEELLIIAQNTIKKAADDYAQSKFIRRIGKGLGENFDLINYKQAAKSLICRSEKILKGLNSDTNAYRQKMKKGLMNINICEHANISQLLENWIQKLVNSEDGIKIITSIVNLVKERTINEQQQDYVFVNYIADMVIVQINILNDNESKKEYIEAWIKEEILKIIEKYHGLIGELIRENLKVLNDDSFVNSLEERVGEDLQWIRVNGTVIGALVGTILYLIASLIS